MNDMSAVIVPKSDQVNAEDYLAGPKTYTIEGVAISPGTEQPVSIKLAGEKRVFRPCKSMSRVLVGAWGADANAYIGRSLTLYCDPKVKWGGLEVGGIRISHMSHIERDMVMSLTATKGKRAPHQVKVLQANGGAQSALTIEGAELALRTAKTLDALRNEWSRKAMAPFRDQLQEVLDERKAALSFDAPQGDHREGRDDRDMGEGHNDTLADHPFRATADALIARAGSVELLADLNKILGELHPHREAAPEELVGEVDAAIDAATTRLGGKK